MPSPPARRIPARRRRRRHRRHARAQPRRRATRRCSTCPASPSLRDCAATATRCARRRAHLHAGHRAARRRAARPRRRRADRSPRARSATAARSPGRWSSPTRRPTRWRRSARPAPRSRSPGRADGAPCLRSRSSVARATSRWATTSSSCALHVPRPRGPFAYAKAGARNAMARAVCGVAVRLDAARAVGVGVRRGLWPAGGRGDAGVGHRWRGRRAGRRATRAPAPRTAATPRGCSRARALARAWEELAAWA